MPSRQSRQAMSSSICRAGAAKAAVVRATLLCPMTVPSLLVNKSPPRVKKKKGVTWSSPRGVWEPCWLLRSRGLGPGAPCSACSSAAGGLALAGCLRSCAVGCLRSSASISSSAALRLQLLRVPCVSAREGWEVLSQSPRAVSL